MAVVDKAEFDLVKGSSQLTSNPVTHKLYTTDSLRLLRDTLDGAAKSLQLVDMAKLQYDTTRAQYFIMFDTEDLRPEPPPPHLVERILSDDGTVAVPGQTTDRNEVVFGDVIIKLREKVRNDLERLIAWSDNEFLFRLRAWIQLFKRAWL